MQSVLGPVDLASFLANQWNKEIVYIPGSEGRLRGLFDWDAINRLLDCQPLNANRARLVRSDGEIPGADFTREEASAGGESLRFADSRAITRLVREGATLVLNGVNQLHPPIARLAAEFGREFRDAVLVNAYIGFAACRGFDVHWDDHEVFVLQVCGRKRWKVWGRAPESPLFRDLPPPEAPDGEPIWEGILKDGDVLYLPRGFWHVAEGLDVATVHLSLGIDCSTGMDVLRWLTREMRTSPLFRTDLARFGSDEERRLQSQALWAELRKRWGDDIVSAYLAASNRKFTSRAGAGLPESVTLDPRRSTIHWLPAKDVELRVEPVLGRFIEFACHGREWKLPRRSETLARLLAARREVALETAIEELRGVLKDYEVTGYIQSWMAEGLVEVGRE